MPDTTNWHDHTPEPPKNDNEYFERMSRMIFNAGLNWRMIDKKWPGIQQAFANFDIATVAKFQEMEIEEVMMAPDVIHNLPKVRAIVKNAQTMQIIIKEHGSFAKYLASLRKAGGEDLLRSELPKRFSFLGDSTTTIFLFSVGEDLPRAHAEWRARHEGK